MGQGIYRDQECHCPQASYREKDPKNKHLFSSPLQEEGKLYFLGVVIARIVIVQLKKELLKW